MSLLQWSALALVCLAGAMSPGPSLAVVAGATIGSGPRAGFAAAWAHALGVGLYAALTVAGISAVIQASQTLFLCMQVAGSAYLLWMAFNLWRSAAAATGSRAGQSVSTVAAARRGFFIAFLNPKLALFMLALFSQFVSADASMSTRLVLIATAGLIDGIWYTLVTVLFSRGPWVTWLASKARSIDRIFAVALALLALLILGSIAREMLT